MLKPGSRNLSRDEIQRAARIALCICLVAAVPAGLAALPNDAESERTANTVALAEAVAGGEVEEARRLLAAGGDPSAETQGRRLPEIAAEHSGAFARELEAAIAAHPTTASVPRCEGYLVDGGGHPAAVHLVADDERMVIGPQALCSDCSIVSRGGKYVFELLTPGGSHRRLAAPLPFRGDGGYGEIETDPKLGCIAPLEGTAGVPSLFGVVQFFSFGLQDLRYFRLDAGAMVEVLTADAQGDEGVECRLEPIAAGVYRCPTWFRQEDVYGEVYYRLDPGCMRLVPEAEWHWPRQGDTAATVHAWLPGPYIVSW